MAAVVRSVRSITFIHYLPLQFRESLSSCRISQRPITIQSIDGTLVHSIGLGKSFNCIVGRTDVRNVTDRNHGTLNFVEARRISTQPDVEESTSLSFPWSGEKRVPVGFWNDVSNHRLYIEWLGGKLGYKRPEDWYRVSTEDFIKNRGWSLLILKYRGSPYDLLRTVFPHFNFLPWLFDKGPHGYFSKRENRQLYVDWLMATVGVQNQNELQAPHFSDHGGGGLLRLFGNSPQKVLDSLVEPRDGNTEEFPELIGSKQRAKLPQRFWDSTENQRRFLDSIGDGLGVRDNDYSPWYKMSNRDFKRLGGSRLLNIHGSLEPLLRKIYPDYDWIPWNFTKFPHNSSLLNPEVLPKAIAFVEQKLGIVSPEDWYRVSRTQLDNLKVLPVFVQNGGLYKSLLKVKHEFRWDKSKFRRLASEDIMVPKTQLPSKK